MSTSINNNEYFSSIGHTENAHPNNVNQPPPILLQFRNAILNIHQQRTSNLQPNVNNPEIKKIEPPITVPTKKSTLDKTTQLAILIAEIVLMHVIMYGLLFMGIFLTHLPVVLLVIGTIVVIPLISVPIIRTINKKIGIDPDAGLPKK